MLWKSRRRLEPLIRPLVPGGLRIYAVGDVHGRADLLTKLLSRIDDDLEKNPIDRAFQVFLGDYIDRGPSSAAVIDLLIERATTHELICLKGNHELYLAEFLANPRVLTVWAQYGALPTLASYGLAPILNANLKEQEQLAAALAQALPNSHREFFDKLKPSLSCGDYFFVHAGVRPGIPLENQTADDLFWIREDFLLHEEPFEKMIVHGHTPVMKADVRQNRINIDTGAYATGCLTCLRLEQDQILFL